MLKLRSIFPPAAFTQLRFNLTDLTNSIPTLALPVVFNFSFQICKLEIARVNTAENAGLDS